MTRPHRACSAKEWRRNLVTHRDQSASDRPKMLRRFPDVFKKHKSRPNCSDDSEQVVDRPPSVLSQSAVVAQSALRARDTVGLAGIPRREHVDPPGKRLGGKVGEIPAPNRTRLHALFFHTGKEQARGTGFPLTESRNTMADASSRESDPNRLVEHSDPGEQRESSKFDGISHMKGGVRIQDRGSRASQQSRPESDF